LEWDHDRWSTWWEEEDRGARLWRGIRGEREREREREREKELL
jgi:hypothetical protein